MRMYTYFKKFPLSANALKYNDPTFKYDIRLKRNRRGFEMEIQYVASIRGGIALV